MAISQEEVSVPPTLDTPWLTIRQSAKYLQCCDAVVRQLLHDGELKASKLNKNYRIHIDALNQFLLRRNKVVPPYRRGTHPWVAARYAKKRRAR